MIYRQQGCAQRGGCKMWLFLASAAMMLAACSTTMPTKASGFLSSYARLSPPSDEGVRRLRTPVALDPARTTLVAVEWRAGDRLSAADRDVLLGTLRDALQTQISHLPANPSGQPAQIRAAITNIATVSPSLNVVSAALIAAPLDRGGAAVEVEALADGDHSQLAALTIGYYAPMSDLKARFSTLAPAKIALQKAAQEFGPLLKP